MFLLDAYLGKTHNGPTDLTMDEDNSIVYLLVEFLVDFQISTMRFDSTNLSTHLQQLHSPSGLSLRDHSSDNSWDHRFLPSESWNLGVIGEERVALTSFESSNEDIPYVLFKLLYHALRKSMR